MKQKIKTAGWKAEIINKEFKNRTNKRLIIGSFVVLLFQVGWIIK